MNFSEDFKPILIFAFVLIASSIIGVVMFIDLINDPSFDKDFSIFLFVMVAWHILTGIGIVVQRFWGLVLFKFYLYVLYIGFPIGTYIARKTLRYMRENKIEKYFYPQQ